MVFVGGALAGCAVGLGVGALLQRRAGSSSLTDRRGFATAIALLALLVAAAALANSDRRRDHAVGAPAASAGAGASTSTSTPPAIASTTSTTIRPSGLIAVPKVQSLERSEAVKILQRAGFKISIESLSLSNVPAGYVISQNPLPDALTTAGTTVTLVVSAAA